MSAPISYPPRRETDQKLDGVRASAPLVLADQGNAGGHRLQVERGASFPAPAVQPEHGVAAGEKLLAGDLLAGLSVSAQSGGGPHLFVIWGVQPIARAQRSA